MKRRKFLSHAIKSASAAFCPQFFLPTLRDSLFSQTAVPKTSPNDSARPQLALTLDDPTLSLASVLKWQETKIRNLIALLDINVLGALFLSHLRIGEAIVERSRY